MMIVKPMIFLVLDQKRDLDLAGIGVPQRPRDTVFGDHMLRISNLFLRGTFP